MVLIMSPLLYILYTNMCKSRHDDRFIIKYADHCVIVTLLQENESSYGPVVEDFFCTDVNKTEGTVMDF